MSARTPEDAVRDLVPLAHQWARGDHATGEQTVDVLRGLADRADLGLGVPALPVLQSFSLRLGARRRVDAAGELHAWPEIASVLVRQARALGKAQYAAVREDRAVLASTFRQIADLHEELVQALARAS